MRRAVRALVFAAVVTPFVLLAAVPLAMAQPADDTAAADAMRALGRNTDPTYMLGELDKPAYCQRRYGLAAAGFDYPTQAFYCRTQTGWIKIPTGPACEEQFGRGAFPDNMGDKCYRLGGADPGENVPRVQSGTLTRIEPGTVDKPFDNAGNDAAPPTKYGPEAIRNAPAAAMARPGVADAPVAGQAGPLGAFNKLPVFIRVLIAGGGAMLIGVWAGGFAVRFMP